MSIDAQTLETLRSADRDTLADWGWILNHWQWPDALQPMELAGLPRSAGPYRQVHPRRASLHDWIEAAIGRKYALYWHNVVRRRAMTPEEFEAWWELHG